MTIIPINNAIHETMWALHRYMHIIRGKWLYSILVTACQLEFKYGAYLEMIPNITHDIDIVCLYFSTIQNLTVISTYTTNNKELRIFKEGYKWFLCDHELSFKWNMIHGDNLELSLDGGHICGLKLSLFMGVFFMSILTIDWYNWI